MGDWSNKKFPRGCRNCGQTELRHVGLGLCQRCYRIPEVLAAAKDDTLPTVDYDALIADQAFLDELDEVESERQSERRPGSVNSPVADREDVSTDLDDSPIDKVKSALFGKKKPKDTAPTTREKSPRGTGRRQSTAETIEDVWTAIGGAALRTGRHAPLGRYLMWQAPAAGEMLDQAISGSIIDRKMLQPAVRARGRLDVVGAVLGPPAVILMIESNPARAPQLVPILKSAIRNSLPTILPAMKKAAAREEKVNKAIVEMFGDDFPPGVDPVDYVIESMFSGFFTTGEPVAEDANAETAT